MDPERLKDISFFEGLSSDELQELGRWTDEVDVPQGKVLIEQGSFPSEFFVIQDGTADVAQDGEKIRSLGPGDFFGEIALVETHRRTASVTAASPMKVVVMTAHHFRTMESELPHAAEQIRAKIDERLDSDAGG